MTDKFSSVPVEADTQILFEQEAKLGEYDILYQKWVWDGIHGESIIFANSDISSLNDDEVESLVMESPLVNADSQLTMKRSDSGFTFVNFNFN